MGVLGHFGGRDVVKTTIAVTNAGDGLSEAMKVDPQLMELGEKVYVVLETEVTKIRFDEMKDRDLVTRVHVLRAGTATIIDEASVKAALDQQRDRIDRARDEERGQGRLPTDQELHAEHALGQHADEPAEGCVDCAEGRTAEEAALLDG